jgi:hypothetical protein
LPRSQTTCVNESTWRLQSGSARVLKRSRSNEYQLE